MKLLKSEIGTIGKDSSVRVYNYDREKIIKNTKERPEWIHFGAGNIFRIFPAALCQRLIEKGYMDTGILVAEGFDYEIIDDIYRPHDDLTLAVTLKADGSVEKEVIGSVAEAVKADPACAPDWDTLEKAFKNGSLKMVSFTITEKGYATKTSSGDLMPAYAEDFSRPVNEAKMLLSRIVYLLSLRYKEGKYPLSFVSMDNCSHNGEKLRDALLLIATSYVENGFLEKDFLDYISDEKQVSFPWSMIDKITPRPDASVLETLEKEGWEDMDAVVTSKHTYIAPYVNAEEAEYLVIEDSFANGRPELEKSGVYMTDRDTVNRTERMKVTTCLNPLHTSLALSGCLLGYKLINEEMKDEDLVRMIKRLGYTEGLPVVTNPGIIEPKAFIDEVISVRLPNPFMPDTPQRIATDTSQKLSIRFGETVKSYRENGMDLGELKVVPLVYALFIRYWMGLDDNGVPFEISPDPMKDEIKSLVSSLELGKKPDDLSGVNALLSNEKIFGYDVTKTELYSSVIEDLGGMLTDGGVRKTIHNVVNR